MSDEQKTINKKRGPSKRFAYEKEQKEILEKIYKITSLSPTNMLVYYDIDNNKEMIDQILKLRDDVKKFFRVVTNYNSKTREYISLIKHVLREMNVKFMAVSKTVYRNHEKIRTSCIILN